MSKCPACQTTLSERVRAPYLQCLGCGTYYHTDVDYPVETQNDNSIERNSTTANARRLTRLHPYYPDLVGKSILDFGCGDGQLVNLAQLIGAKAVGIDVDTQLQLPAVASGSIDAVFMVEVLEHLFNPFAVLTDLARVLKDRGYLYLETGILDNMPDPSTDPYVNPTIGHCTVYSRLGLLEVMNAVGFTVRRQYDSSTYLFRKVKDDCSTI